jgi:hypothetical protein
LSDDEALHYRWLLSDSPSRAWQRASFDMYLAEGRKALRWMAKALKIDAGDPRAWFALAGFAPMEIQGTWHIAAAVPPKP